MARIFATQRAFTFAACAIAAALFLTAGPSFARTCGRQEDHVDYMRKLVEIREGHAAAARRDMTLNCPGNPLCDTVATAVHSFEMDVQEYRGQLQQAISQYYSCMDAMNGPRQVPHTVRGHVGNTPSYSGHPGGGHPHRGNHGGDNYPHHRGHGQVGSDNQHHGNQGSRNRNHPRPDHQTSDEPFYDPPQR